MSRIVASIAGAVLLTVGLSWWFQTEVLAALGLFVKFLATMSWASVFAFVRTFAIRFFVFQLPKRILFSFVAAYFISDEFRDHLVAELDALKKRLEAKWTQVNERFASLGFGPQLAIAVVVSTALIALSVFGLGIWGIFWYIPSTAWSAAKMLGRKVLSYTTLFGYRTFFFTCWNWLLTSEAGRMVVPVVKKHEELTEKVKKLGAPTQQKIAERVRRLLPKRTHGEKRPEARRHKRPRFVPPQPKRFQPENKHCPSLTGMRAKENKGPPHFDGPRRH